MTSLNLGLKMMKFKYLKMLGITLLLKKLDCFFYLIGMAKRYPNIRF